MFVRTLTHSFWNKIDKNLSSLNKKKMENIKFNSVFISCNYLRFRWKCRVYLDFSLPQIADVDVNQKIFQDSNNTNAICFDMLTVNLPKMDLSFKNQIQWWRIRNLNWSGNYKAKCQYTYTSILYCSTGIYQSNQCCHTDRPAMIMWKNENS